MIAAAIYIGAFIAFILGIRVAKRRAIRARLRELMPRRKMFRQVVAEIELLAQQNHWTETPEG